MSKAIVDSIIRDMIIRRTDDRRRVDKIIRDYQGKTNPHLITITFSDIKQTVVANTIAVLQKKKTIDARKAEIEQATGKTNQRLEAQLAIAAEQPELMTAMEKVANYVFDNFEQEYNSLPLHKDALPAKREGNAVQLYFSKYDDSMNKSRLKVPFENLVKRAMEQEPAFRGVTSTDGWGKFTRQTQMLHTERTVGFDTLGEMDRHLSGKGAKEGVDKGMNEQGGDQASFDKAFKEVIEESSDLAWKDIRFSTADARNAAHTVLKNMIADVSWAWDSSQGAQPENFLKNIRITGRIGPNAANKPGEESTDWKRIKPMLEAAIEEELEKTVGKELAVKGASPSPVSLITTLAVNRILRDFKGLSTLPGITVKMNKKEQKVVRNKRDKSVIGKVGKKKNLSKKSTTTQPKRGFTTEGQKTIDKKESPWSPISLLTLLNRKLPDTLLANMTEPALVNRTGRFRQSVKVQNMMSNKKFPTIQYKYQLDPYEVFEKDPDRDPRKLIDKSIREIAAQVMKGRFYTQRIR